MPLAAARRGAGAAAAPLLQLAVPFWGTKGHVRGEAGAGAGTVGHVLIRARCLRLRGALGVPHGVTQLPRFSCARPLDSAPGGRVGAISRVGRRTQLRGSGQASRVNGRAYLSLCRLSGHDRARRLRARRSASATLLSRMPCPWHERSQLLQPPLLPNGQPLPWSRRQPAARDRTPPGSSLAQRCLLYGVPAAGRASDARAALRSRLQFLRSRPPQPPRPPARWTPSFAVIAAERLHVTRQAPTAGALGWAAQSVARTLRLPPRADSPPPRPGPARVRAPATMSMRGGAVPRKKDFKKGIDADDARRKREDNIIELRKAKRDEQLQKKRLVNAGPNYAMEDSTARPMGLPHKVGGGGGGGAPRGRGARRMRA